MPKGATANKGNAKKGGNSSNSKGDDFDTLLQDAVNEVAKAQRGSSNHKGQQAVGKAISAAYQDPAKMQKLMTTAQAGVAAMRKGETTAQREAREAAEQEMQKQLWYQAKQQSDLMRAHKAREENERIAAMMKYTNTHIPLAAEDGEWKELCPGKWIRMEQFNDDNDMPAITDMFAKSLSEPYTTFTYMHFMFGWKDLCIMLMGLEQKEKPAADVRGNLIGCVVSRVTKLRATFEPFGYIAMLAVDPSFRGHKLGQRLVTKSIELMKKKDCVCVQLETPVTNERALNLYTSLGFVKTKYFVRYYMDGSDAVRLRLFTKPWTPEMIQLIDDEQ